jgi:stage II sporulation protein D
MDAMGKVGSTTGRRFRARARRLLRSPRRYWRAWSFGWGLAGLCFTVLTIGALVVTTPWGCTQTDLNSRDVRPSGRIIRVRLAQSQDSVVLTASQPPAYATTGQANGTPGVERVLNLPAGTPMAVTWTPAGWRCGIANLGTGELIIRPQVAGSLTVFMPGAANDKAKAYRGTFRLVPITGGKFDVVNDVDLDDYLRGVIAKELYPGWHDEAYRAQAIVARTYALYEMNARETPRHFDVYADTRSQVYGGMSAETAKSRAAVDATAGVVAAYGPPGQERIFKAYFSSCCGGVTQSNADAFNEPLAAPLTEQSVGNLCAASTKFTWDPVVVLKQELSDRVKRWAVQRNHPLAQMEQLRSVQIESRNHYKRPVRFAIIDSRGRKFLLAAEEFRWAVNCDAPEGQTLASSFIETIVNESDRVRFIGGHGYGHGVGMCQWCTQARALAGMRHEDIVTAAYPGARLMRAY